MQQNSDLWKIGAYVGSGTPTLKMIAKQTDLTFGRGKSEIDVSNKSSGDWAEFLAGRKNAEVTFEAFIDTAPIVGEISEPEMDAIFDSPAATKWAIVSTATGAIKREMFCVLTKFDEKFSSQTGAMFSITLRITGQPTSTVVA